MFIGFIYFKLCLLGKGNHVNRADRQGGWTQATNAHCEHLFASAPISKYLPLQISTFSFPGVTCHWPKATLPFKAAAGYLSSCFKAVQPSAVISPLRHTGHASSPLFACPLTQILSLKYSPAPLLPPPGATKTGCDSLEILSSEATQWKYSLILLFSSQLLIEQAFLGK